MHIDQGKAQYAELDEYARVRTSELAPMLQPFIEVTNHYGELICEIVLILGKTPPTSKHELAYTRPDGRRLRLSE